MNKVLLACNNLSTTQHMQNVLGSVGIDHVICTSSGDVLKSVMGEKYLAAILHNDLPGLPTQELVKLLRSIQGQHELPIFVIGEATQQKAKPELSDIVYYQAPIDSAHLTEVLVRLVDNHQLLEQQKALIVKLTQTSQSLSRRALQLNTLAQVIKHITSILDLEVLLPAVTSLVCSTFDYYFVSVWLPADDAKFITLKACHNNHGEQTFPSGFKINVTEQKGILTHVTRTKQAWLANDVALDPYYWAMDNLPLTRSEIVLPLIVGNSFLGIIDIQSEKTNGFDSVDQVLCQALADSTAIAIRNAQLYTLQEHRVQQRTKELENVIRRMENLDREKTNFMQVVSHELLTPLTFVLGFSQMLEEECQVDHPAAPHIKRIRNGAQRMDEIVQNMLDIVQLDVEHVHLNLQQVALHGVIKQAAQDFQHALSDRNIALSFDLSDMPRIESDSTALEKLFSHLISNAIKYTPNNGMISITGRVESQPESAVHIIVHDTGIGIDPEALELIFSKFYRVGDVARHSSSKTNFKGGGAGLGLAIAQGIVEAHHGQIWAESPGLDEVNFPGSSFHIVLPLKQPCD